MATRIIFWFGAISLVSFLFNLPLTKAEIQVYDANDQYLGILVDENPPLIFVPSEGFFMSLQVNPPIQTVGDGPGFHFKTTDCSGVPHWAGTAVDASHPVFLKMDNIHIGQPYYDDGIFVMRYGESELFKPKSYLWWENGPTCYTISPNEPRLYFPLKHAVQTLPLPFSFPLSLPYRYEYVAPSQIAAAPVPSMTKGGIVLLSSLLIAAAYFSIRRPKKLKK